MKIYVVTRVCDDEYGCASPFAVFSTREKAENCINKQDDKKTDVWWTENGIDTYDIEEYDLDEEPKFEEVC